MKKRKSINRHTLIVINSIVLFSLALLACPEISSSKKTPSKKQTKQTTKTPDTPNTPNLQSSPQYTFSDTLSKVLYIAAKNQNVPDEDIVDEDTSEAAHTIFKALGVQAGDTLSVIHVDDNGDNKNDGSTWKKAKRTIKNALDTITKNAKDLPNPYLVLIGSETYTPTNTLNMKNHVAIIGGFDSSSDEASGYERNGKTIISGEDKRRVFFNSNLDTSAVLARVTINAGNATDGGGMYNSKSSPTITHTTFSKNTASRDGGGMYNANSSPIITHTTFSKNDATNHGGGMFNFKSSPTITHTTFSGNTASQNGGGMSNDHLSSPQIKHTTFSQNTASKNGGGMSNDHSSSPQIKHTTFSQNTASQNGGGMYNLDTSSPQIMHTTFSGNTAKNNGGGMYNLDTSSPQIMHTTFSKNTASRNGGGMYNENSSPTIMHTTFSKNNAEFYGGGMYNDHSSSPIIMHTTFSGNTTSQNGGGMSNDHSSSPIIMYTTFSGNTASKNGGGMYNLDTSSPQIMHTIFSGNTAGYGGGIANISNSSPTIMHTTFSKNNAEFYGGGMYNLYKSSPTISSSIFWGNTKNGKSNQIENNNSTPVIAYSIVQGGYTSGTVIITEDPKLQPLANNGGFIETIAIKTESSAAINKGLYGAHKDNVFYYSSDGTAWYTDPTLQTSISLPSDATKYTTDARGYKYKAHPDIGAFEYEGTVPLPTP